MVENEQRIRQAARNVKRYLQSMGVNTPAQGRRLRSASGKAGRRPALTAASARRHARTMADPAAQISDIAHTIQLAVAPVFMLAGIGSFLNVLTGRLDRVVDRARFLAERASRRASATAPSWSANCACSIVASALPASRSGCARRAR